MKRRSCTHGFAARVTARRRKKSSKTRPRSFAGLATSKASASGARSGGRSRFKARTKSQRRRFGSPAASLRRVRDTGLVINELVVSIDSDAHASCWNEALKQTFWCGVDALRRPQLLSRRLKNPERHGAGPYAELDDLPSALEPRACSGLGSAWERCGKATMRGALRKPDARRS